jgi:hypothetical protein
MDSMSVLREQLARTRARQVDENTVVRFVVEGTRTYAALYVNKRWYLTGKGKYFGGHDFDSVEFFEQVLARADEGTVEVATRFAPVDG